MTVTATPDAAPTQSPSTGLMGRRWIKWLLVGSLAVNAIVIGAVAGAFWRGRPMAMLNSATGGGANLVGYVGSLPHDRRRDLFAKMQPLRQELQASRRDVRAARRDMYDALAAESFDRQKYVDAQTRLNEAETKLRSMLQPLVADVAAGMSHHERRGFMRWRGDRRGGMMLPGDEDGLGPAPKRP